MGVASLRVELLEVCEDPLRLLYLAYRQCYSKEFVGDMGEVQGVEDFLRRMMASGHTSPLEHVKFTFAIEGVSRALTHQLVRHRIASYSQQSQRYVDMADFDYVIPPSIASDPVALQEFERVIAEIRRGYRRIMARFAERGISGEEAKQDARFLLPQAAETKIVVTMNCRELLHFFSQRCCQRAQWEIRELAWRMLEICRQRLPVVFEKAGPKCEALGYCPEGEFSCGRYPPKEEVLKG